jgi:hypothetical protein
MTEAPQTLEQTLLDLVRQLPLERQKQVVDFVRFLELETLKENENDAKWEELFATQASEDFLNEMAGKVREDIKTGRITPILAHEDELEPGRS